VRIIGRDPEREPAPLEAPPAPAPAPDPEPVPAAADEPVEQQGLDEPADGDVDLEALLAGAPSDPPPAVVAEDPTPEEEPADAATPASDDLPQPLARDEIRPRIEDLFARIRADREAATASAREVLDAARDDDGSTVLVDDGERAEAPVGAPDPDPAVAGSSVAAATTDADERLLQARDATTEPLAGQLTKRLKRALQDEQNASLDRLRTSRGAVTVEQILSAPDLQRAPYRHLAVAFLEEAARAGASASKFGPVAVATDDLAAQLADDLAGALRSRLDAVLGRGSSDDLELAAMGERISSVYREWKVQKLERLAIHYLVAAHERGGFLAHPEGTPLRWLVDDEGPCPDCEDNALAGPTPRGEAFPTGQLHPPAHLGCRCLLARSPH
jgi:hypothetical protein